MSIKAVIFDMNGTIVDDEPIHEAAMHKVCKDYGAKVSHKEFKEEYIGRPDADCFKKIIKKHGLKGIPVVELVNKKFKEYISLIHDSDNPEKLKVIPGAVELIKKLNKMFKVALATGAHRDEALMILDSFGLRNCFETIVSAEDVLKGKPDPEPYLLAARRLGVEPRECVAIEDSSNGVRAAKRAKMYCIGFHNPSDDQNLGEADVEVNSLSDISDALIKDFGAKA